MWESEHFIENRFLWLYPFICLETVSTPFLCLSIFAEVRFFAVSFVAYLWFVLFYLLRFHEGPVLRPFPIPSFLDVMKGDELKATTGRNVG